MQGVFAGIVRYVMHYQGVTHDDRITARYAYGDGFILALPGCTRYTLGVDLRAQADD